MSKHALGVVAGCSWLSCIDVWVGKVSTYARCISLLLKVRLIHLGRSLGLSIYTPLVNVLDKDVVHCNRRLVVGGVNCNLGESLPLRVGYVRVIHKVVDAQENEVNILDV